MPKGVYARSVKQKEQSQKLGKSRIGKKPYTMTEEIKKKISQGLKGNIPYNKGMEKPEKLTKVLNLKLGNAIICTKHGEHKNWRLHSSNNVQCNHCACEWQMKRRRKDPLKYLFRDAQKHTQKQGRDFDIFLSDLEELKKNQQNKCAYTDIEFSENMPASLDRIDSKKGYIKDNIQLVCVAINKMKSDLNENEFLDLCQKVTSSKARKK